MNNQLLSLNNTEILPYAATQSSTNGSKCSDLKLSESGLSNSCDERGIDRMLMSSAGNSHKSFIADGRSGDCIP